MKHYLFRTMLLVLLTGTGAAYALTLGEAQVRSFLGQPLNAEIDLIGLAPGQHEDLRLRIANDRHFDRLGIAYTRFLTALNFDVAQSNGRWIVRVRSDRPVTEPFLDFPLQMTWPGGQLIRQYTLLLDPPRRIQPARTTAGRRATAPVAAGPSSPDTAASSYGPVERGETLWPIAKKLKPRGITTRQMAMALLRANPHAFIDGNINRLRAGVTLEVPQRSFIEELDAASARAEFNAQTRQWQAPVATSPRTVEAPLTRPSAPAPVPEDQAKAPAQARTAEADKEQQSPQAQLRILTEKTETEGKPGTSQDLQEQLLVTMEEIESNRITTDAIEARLARMESELERMQKLVELKDAQIAAMKSEAAAREAIRAAAQTAEPPPPPPASVPKAVITPTAPPGDQAPISITRIEALPTDNAPAARPWHEEYLWVIWAALGLLGLAALSILVRRPRPAAESVSLAPLPEVADAPPSRFAPEAAPASERLSEAEEDFRRLAEQRLVEDEHEPPEPTSESAVEPVTKPDDDLPELEISGTTGADAEIDDGISNSLLDDLLDDDDMPAGDRNRVEQETGYSDDDIASWVAELDSETERAETQSANDERIPLDDEVPGILTELDDQLSADEGISETVGAVTANETIEDDTFSMSLDLARAYLEIGDQEGARDMLKQALSGARDPEHRRQIEELLAQID